MSLSFLEYQTQKRDCCRLFFSLFVTLENAARFMKLSAKTSGEQVSKSTVCLSSDSTEIPL